MWRNTALNNKKSRLVAGVVIFLRNAGADMKTKLNELLEFPTPFTYKVMGQALPELVDQVVEVVQRHAPGDYSPTVKPSSKGNYHSVSITINATHIEQVETLYEELGNIDIVRMVL
ncbi:Proposed lipoate regulatory protein YbeD [Salmonella enterica subsp. enterica serovar Urbana str. R8-2977]|uniref:UPF0250 protein YbeD n=1 Tax=Salmonella enterica subsp. enterica serovar Urbana str. R8-2977 TaxID=913084 RepID=G5RS60_SALET|nr:Proposed lipoate regulatory protein YbeD [Salmonella enterica subsp. enterica serovar Urbana str. R8-2977]